MYVVEMYVGNIASCPGNVLMDRMPIELTFVTLGRGFKKAGSVLFDIGDAFGHGFFLIRLHQSKFA